MNIQRTIVMVVLMAMVASACSEKAYEGAIEGKFKREELGISSKIPGRIVELRVEEGDVVHKGDTLAVLDFPEVEAKLQQAEGAYLSAKSQYEMSLNGATDDERRQMDAVFAAAKEQFDFLEKTKERMESMYEDSLISAQQYDEVLAKYNGARAQFEQARAKKNEVDTGVRTEKQMMAKGQMDRAKGAIAEANVAYSERFIIAPETMSIQTISLNEGELALAGYTIINGYILSEPYVRVTISESKLNEFKTGSFYTVKQPFTNETFSAKLVSVKELAAYANKTSSYPNYELGEAIYELKLVPEKVESVRDWYANTTVLIEE